MTLLESKVVGIWPRSASIKGIPSTPERCWLRHSPAGIPKYPGASLTSRRLQETMKRPQHIYEPRNPDLKRSWRNTRSRSLITPRSSMRGAESIHREPLNWRSRTSPTVRRCAHSNRRMRQHSRLEKPALRPNCSPTHAHAGATLQLFSARR